MTVKIRITIEEDETTEYSREQFYKKYGVYPKGNAESVVTGSSTTADITLQGATKADAIEKAHRYLEIEDPILRGRKNNGETA